jgi:hypothetical protein
MRAVAIETQGKIAVVAEDAKALGVVVCPEPLVEGFTAPLQCVAVLCATPVDMVDAQKLNSGLAATGAPAPVMVNEFTAKLQPPPLALKQDLIWVSPPPFLAFTICLFGISFVVCLVMGIEAILTAYRQFVIAIAICAKRCMGKFSFALVADTGVWNSPLSVLSFHTLMVS